MAQEDFANLAVFVDGVQLTKLTSVSLSTESGQQRIDTLVGGLAGFTPGSGETTVQLGFVVPLAGFEFNFQEAAFAGTYHSVQIIAGPYSWVGQGKFTSAEVSQSVNAATEGTATFTAEMKRFQR